MYVKLSLNAYPSLAQSTFKAAAEPLGVWFWAPFKGYKPIFLQAVRSSELCIYLSTSYSVSWSKFGINNNITVNT